MKKYKVLIVHNYYQIPGGEDTVVASEIELLKDNGHEVFSYTRHNSEIQNTGVLDKIKLFFNTIFSFKTYKDVKEIIENNNINIVHVHNTLPLVSPSVYYSAFKTKTPIVQTVHNFRLLCPGATFIRDMKNCEECVKKGLNSAIKHKCYRNSKLQTTIIVFMMKIHRMLGTYKKVNGYIALTEFNKEKLSDLINKDKIYVKPNFKKNNCYETNIDRKFEDYYMFLGRLDKLKGINFLVEAWKDIKNSNLLIIGDGFERAYIENYIRQHGLDNVKILGYMKREKAFSYLRKAKALIVPSQCYESFGMTVVEAFSYGVPVIAAKIGALKVIVNDNVNGLLFKYNNKEELISKIKILDSNQMLIKQLGLEANKTYLDLYSESENYNKLINIYNNVIQEKKEEV